MIPRVPEASLAWTLGYGCDGPPCKLPARTAALPEWREARDEWRFGSEMSRTASDTM